MANDNLTIDEARTLVQGAQRILVLSGAGLSKASGIPTYRDAGGLWTEGDNAKYSRASSVSTDKAGFEAFWRARLAQLEMCKPNAAHYALAKLQSLRSSTMLVTQNVDGLMQEAGCKNVYELHGSARRWRCKGCTSKGPFKDDHCLKCGGKLRPDVVLFGDKLDENMVHEVMAEVPSCDLVLLVGTSLEVYPAAGLPELALRHGARLLFVDPKPPLIWEQAGHRCLKMGAEEALPALVG